MSRVSAPGGVEEAGAMAAISVISAWSRRAGFAKGACACLCVPSTVLLQWMMPRPPKRAMWMAICASVTVSIGLEISGVLSAIRLVASVRRLTSLASKLMWPGRMM